MRAQFVPGRIFTVDIASAFCEHGTDEYVLEIDPEAGTTREFAFFPDCPGLGSLAMSPDGKRLRVVAFHWGAILEFDSQGNWEVVIDGSDGIFPAAEPNGITYDRDGNFYVSNYYTLNAKVFRFPSNGGAPTILAYANNNGVSITAPGPISVGPSGDAYVADEDRLIRIGSDGLVEMFDTYDVTPFSDEIDAVLVDDFGIVFTWVELGGIYRTEPAKPLSRERLLECGLGFCPGHTLSLSPVRNRICAQSFDPSIGPFGSDTIISIDPDIGSFERVLVADVGVSIFAIVPMRGDVDGDGDSDHSDMEWFAACLSGPAVAMAPPCNLADMDADGDVDLFDTQYFMDGYSAFAESAK